MKRKDLWLILSCLMVAILLLASCSPKVTTLPTTSTTPATSTKPATSTTPTTSTTPATSTTVAGEVPKYGGVFTLGNAYAPYYFDAIMGSHHLPFTLAHTNERLIGGDWAKGPAGTGETAWVGAPSSIDTKTGYLAESWEIVQPDTLIYHIRKGVHWQNKPPTSGREMTADDVAFSLTRQLITGEKSLLRQNMLGMIKSIAATDKWTVVVKTVPQNLGDVFGTINLVAIVPRDMVEKYGDLSDWRNSCGTGPFILTDYVSASSSTFVRNPDYWMKDPVHPANQLPYLDGLKTLYITDASTRMAALRTSKVDWLGGWDIPMQVGWEDANNLIKANPQLKYLRALNIGSKAMWFRIDTKPFDDIRVRRALNMAVDRVAIVTQYYSGNAEILAAPIAPVPEQKNIYIPLAELPQSTRELFEYHPDKAKQLLADAGYPTGFKAEIVTGQVTSDLDLLAIVKNAWSKIGVDLDIQIKDTAVFSSISNAKSYKQMIMAGNGWNMPYKIGYYIPGNIYNFSFVNDPKINKVMDEVSLNPFDDAKRDPMIHELLPYLLDQAYCLAFPQQYAYTFWQPWVKGYHGEQYLASYWDFPTYIWYDQDLKEKMTGRR